MSFSRAQVRDAITPVSNKVKSALDREFKTKSHVSAIVGGTSLNPDIAVIVQMIGDPDAARQAQMTQTALREVRTVLPGSNANISLRLAS
ncbi:MAG TPA: hypothetical protein VIN59_10035 [Alphaproteobacteria bacterium]